VRLLSWRKIAITLIQGFLAGAEENLVGGATLAQTRNTHSPTPNCQNKNE